MGPDHAQGSGASARAGSTGICASPAAGLAESCLVGLHSVSVERRARGGEGAPSVERSLPASHPEAPFLLVLHVHVACRVFASVASGPERSGSSSGFSSF